MNDLKLKSDLLRMKVLLIALTLFDVFYLIDSNVKFDMILKFQMAYQMDVTFLVVNLLVAGVFIWFNWMRMAIGKQKKIDFTWLIIIFGVIGMWIWIFSNHKQKITVNLS